MDKENDNRIQERYKLTARRLAAITDPKEREEAFLCALAGAYNDGMHDDFMQHLKGERAKREGVER